MIRNALIIIGILLFAACSTTIKKSAIEQGIRVIEITQGKMKKVGETYEIYEFTSDMDYEVNDSCVYAEKNMECLRHGFVLKYDSFGKDVKLDCTANTNITVNAGNVEREKYVDTNKDDFYMELKGDEKEFVNVQYVSGQPGLEDLYINTTCSFGGKSVFTFSQRIRF